MATKTSTLDDVDFSKVDKATTKKKANKPTAKAAAPAPAAKVSKKAAPAKAAAPKKAGKAEEPAPSDVYKWPFKSGSMMQLSFKLAYEGISQADLEKAVSKLGRSPKIAMDVLRGGIAGCGAINGTADATHTWKLSEDGGILKLTKVKYLGPKAEAEKKVARTKAAAATEESAGASA